MHRTLLLASAVGVCTGTAAAAPLVGVAPFGGFGSQALYSIDPTTGTSTLIGDTGLAEINGLAWDGSTLYAFTTDADLYAVDLTTGAAALVGSNDAIVPEGGMTFGAGTAYTVDVDELTTVDLATGGLSFVGSLGPAANDVSGLAYADGEAPVIYGYSLNGDLEDTLVAIDPTTGVATTIGGTGLDATNVGGLDVDPMGGALYLTDGGSLFTVDTGTGATTLVGDLGLAGFSGIAFVPAPGSVALLCGAGLLARRRRVS